MIQYISVILITTALFFAMLFALALKPSVSGRFTGFMFLLTGIGGLLMYGYGYSVVTENQILAVIKALLSVCGMFVGQNDLSAISEAPHMTDIWIVILFWLLHTFAFYTTASAVIISIGANLLKRVRMALALGGDLTLIYGTGEDALEFGQECNKIKGMSVVFVSRKAGGDAQGAIDRMGAVYRSDAVEPTARILSRMGIRPGRRKIYVYAMDTQSENYRFAAALKDTMEEVGIHPSQTSLLLYGNEEMLAGKLQAYQEIYGYGYVMVYQRQDQLARMMIEKCPPWNMIEFDEDGKAREDFEALLIGFGSMGQSALKALLRNAQFYGSAFHVTIVDRACNQSAGYLFHRCPEIMKQYDIRLLDMDGRSTEFYRLLQERRSSLRYIVIATGQDRLNQEIADQILSYMRNQETALPIIRCNRSDVILQWTSGVKETCYHLISREEMDFNKVDHMAMRINHVYCSDSQRSLWDDWKNCDYFSRMSCRAVADFLPAYLKMLHKNRDEILTDAYELTDRQMEICGRTEHLRWSAFHYTMGFAPMSESEWLSRAASYQQEIRETGRSSIRIGKNMQDRHHACLIPWEELDALSLREAEVTGVNPMYQQKDRDNILMIPEFLREACEE